MYCKKCGIEIQEGTNFCPECGANQNSTSSQSNNQFVGVEQKSKIAAGLLGIFLGALGIHNFYLGYTKNGVIQLLLTTIGSFLIIGPFISGIWALIEGIRILSGSISVDAKGVPLKD